MACVLPMPLAGIIPQSDPKTAVDAAAECEAIG
jgi:hypothetical protein